MPRTRHGQIEIDRTFGSSVERLFAAWSDTRALERWCVPGDAGWAGAVEVHEFRVGGVKRIRFGPPGEPPYLEESRYVDILANRRILNTEIISRGDRRISASILTLEFSAAGAGSALSVTDQIALVGEDDTPEARRAGWAEVLEKLAREVSP